MLHPIQKVRLFYTQTVLPAIYDYSLSFYEALCKLAATVNDTIESVEEISDKTDDLQTQIDNLDPAHVTEQISEINQNITNINNTLDDYSDDIEGLRTDVNNIRADITDINVELADHETRITLLEGAAYGSGVVPVDAETVAQMIQDAIDGLTQDTIAPLQNEVDAVVAGGYTPEYGAVDFGKGKLLMHDPIPQDPDRMVLVTDDIQVSAAYVRALNMVYGSFYISWPEDVTLNYNKVDKYVLCWKNSEDLPPIAHDFPGIKVEWDNETHAPDLVKFGINYNNALTKRVDTYFTPNRDNYISYIGYGYRWYSEVYMNDIAVGSTSDPGFQWAPIQIPFCYLSIASGGMTETNIEDIEDVSRGIDQGALTMTHTSLGINQIGPDVCRGFGFEFNIHNLTTMGSATYAGNFFGSARMSREGAVVMNYKSDNDNYIRFYGRGASTNATISNKISAGATYKVIYLYREKTLTLYDALGDVVGVVENFDYIPNSNPNYNETAVLFGFIRDTGTASQTSYGTIDKFRVFTLH